MEVGAQSGMPAPRAGSLGEAGGADRILARACPLGARDVLLYRACEDLTEPLIYSMVVFSPWAFGTTQLWSIWLMNAAGYLLGLLLAVKLAVRWLRDYHPPRWDEDCATGRPHTETPGRQEDRSPRRQDRGTATVLIALRSEVRSPRFLARSLWSTVRGLLRVVPRPRSQAERVVAALAGLTIAILSFCLVSAVNARATFHREQVSFAYHHCIMWLPHSLDRGRTWLAFWTYLGLACSFWAIRDWLLGKTGAEERAERCKLQPSRNRSGPLLPARLIRLLWILAVNGGILGMEGIFQRLEGSGKLLFLVKPHVNEGADTQFGPYAYRANASQYFNLLWPVCLGFWWTLNRSRGDTRGAHHLLLWLSAIMAACPVISTSRGGALITVGIITLAAFFLVATHFLLAAQRHQDRRPSRTTLAFLVLFFCSALALGLALGWKTLRPRMAHISKDYEVRQRMYQFARPMAEDYPLFGTGPGTFETVFQLYRFSTRTYWPAQLHNDWLETRITFGWIGSGLIVLALVAVMLRWFARGGIHGGRLFIILTWLALGGCLVHARYDFPFQIYSILLLFLVLCAVLSNLSRRPL